MSDPLDPALYSHPNLYLKRAQQMAHTVRSWIRRHHPTPPEPENDGVEWILGVFDTLDKELARGVEAADAHLPWSAEAKAATQEREHRDLDAHYLRQTDTTVTEIQRWSHSARWSPAVTPGDLDRLDAMTTKAKDQLRRLIAAAEDAALGE